MGMLLVCSGAFFVLCREDATRNVMFAVVPAAVAALLAAACGGATAGATWAVERARERAKARSTGRPRSSRSRRGLRREARRKNNVWLPTYTHLALNTNIGQHEHQVTWFGMTNHI